MCWTLLPYAHSVFLKRFSVMALERPVGTAWAKVASVNRKDGTFFRFYENYHDGLYVNRVTADADLQAMELFLRLTNFTSKMENIYCIKYEMSGKDDVSTCVSQPLILRDAGEYISIILHCARSCGATSFPGLFSWRLIERHWECWVRWTDRLLRASLLSIVPSSSAGWSSGVGLT